MKLLTVKAGMSQIENALYSIIYKEYDKHIKISYRFFWKDFSEYEG